MAGTGKIRWREVDTLALRKAVSKFNAKITRVSKKNPALAGVQPERLVMDRELERLRQLTRPEFKRELGKMSRYLRNGAELPYTTRAGVNTTVWQKQEIDNALRSINARRRQQLAKYEPSAEKGTLYTIDQAALRPRKNNVETIQPKKWDDFVRNMEKQLIEADPKRQQEKYKRNFLQAIENQLGRGSRLYTKVEMMDAGILTRFYYTDPVVSIAFTYDPRDAAELEDIMLERIGSADW